MRTWWRTFRSIFKAQRQLGMAKRLQRAGRTSEAFRVAVEAFAILGAIETPTADPAVRTILAFHAVFLDQLAQAVGHPTAAREELVAALQFCEDVATANPRFQGRLQQYIDWYRYRLSQIGESVVH